LIVLQSDHLDALDTRIVAPLVAPTKIEHFERLMPEVNVVGKHYVVVVQEMGAFPVRMMEAPVANLDADRYRLVGALDLLFTGI
jgi:hypothetical protein